MSKKRSKAREFALQAVYQWQLSGNDVNDVINHFLLEQERKSFEVKYFQELFKGVAKEVDDLDELLKPYIDRDIEQVDPVERAVLRLGAYELSRHPEVPYRVVINESVELAKKYGAEQGHKYVNGVIDKLASKVRQIEVSANRAARTKSS